VPRATAPVGAPPLVGMAPIDVAPLEASSNDDTSSSLLSPRAE
jgi:hypothetical protein